MVSVLKITTFHVSHIPMLTGIIYAYKYDILQSNGNYPIYRAKGVDNQVNCFICDLMFDEIKSDMNLMQHYTRLVHTYGQSLVDHLIIRQEEVIEHRIQKALNTIMDEMFQTDSLDVIIYGANPTHMFNRNRVAAIVGDYIKNHYLVHTTCTSRFLNGQMTEERISISKKDVT